MHVLKREQPHQKTNKERARNKAKATKKPASRLLMAGHKIDAYHVHAVNCAKEKASGGSERSV